MIEAFEGITPQIHHDAFVHARATLIGQVEIGPFSSVWPGVIMRGDMGKISVGSYTSIQDGTMAHITEGFSETRIGDRVTVGHGVILHGCVVENDCLIGMGSILLDNCVIGEGSLIGAGALITVGTKIPPGSLVVGSPGKVVRQLGDKDRLIIAHSWKTYADYAKRYVAQLAQ